ncbi:segregation and condensation protein B [Flavisolibacter ginsengisoli DSM 18119]|jgi:segregation and condensation protein B|uniref:Segregation and condensation protein B n=2 Tax=Flavisolibacter TaxID=398041 RepID=A0A1M5FDY8_9BACT|nr:segregation and condensation protein B [Flavisolibacter ginsengisoli DSM 18119]
MHIYKMEISNLIPHIEALIFASDKPLTPAEITDLVNQAFGFMEDKIEVEQVDASLEGIVEKYNSEFYPFEVRQSGGGWQFLTKKDYHKTVAQLNGEKFLKRLSAAALETLAIVAYKQPVTKGEIEAIRGVSSDYAVQKLLEKELIVITGRNEKLPGHPLVYATSKNFMDYFGINSPEDLPKIKEVLADQVVQPTIVHHTDFETSENLVVTEDGELVIPAIDQEAEELEVGQLNGHSFSQEGEISNDEGDQPTEDIPTEEAIEEYIADEVFIEGDEEETEEIVQEEVATEESSDESTPDVADQATGDESNPEDDPSVDGEEEEKN